jgi:exportin-7
MKEILFTSVNTLFPKFPQVIGMDLPAFDQLCQCAYSQTQGPARQEAEGRLLTLSQNTEAFRFIASSLESPSISSATMHFALSALTKILTHHWVAVSPTDRVAARCAVLAFLRARGADAEVHIVNQTCLLLARMTKMGWFDCPPSDPSMLPFHSMSVSVASSPTSPAAPSSQMPFQEIVGDFQQFWNTGNAYHICIALSGLLELVSEMNANRTLRSLAKHRRVAMSFRDASLFTILNLSLQTLTYIRGNQISFDSETRRYRTLELALRLCGDCLSFDFIGASYEETSDDNTTIQIPNAWKGLFQDGQLVSVLSNIYSYKPMQLHCDASACQLCERAQDLVCRNRKAS